MDERLDWVTASEKAGLLSGQVAQLHAQLVCLAARVIEDDAWVGVGIRSVEHFLEVQTGLDRHTVSKLVAVARRAGELPELMGLLGEGTVTLDQAAVVAQHAPAAYSADVAEFAQYATVTQLRRGLAGYFHDTDRTVIPVRPSQEASVQISASGQRFRLTFLTGDMVAGALVEQAIREAKDALFTAGNSEATLADGLVEVAHRSLATISEPSRSKRFQVLVHLDTQGQSWLHKRGALPQHVADRYACQGQLIPVWETDGKPVAVGRAQRIVPDRVRRLIEDRDKGCRYPACHSSGYLEVHHKTHWRDGGPTDPSNLLCLCSFHHDEHHRGSFVINGDPERLDGLTFTNNLLGWTLPPERPTPPPPGGLPPPIRTGPTGEPLETRWLTFKTNPNYSAVGSPMYAVKTSIPVAS